MGSRTFQRFTKLHPSSKRGPKREAGVSRRRTYQEERKHILNVALGMDQIKDGCIGMLHMYEARLYDNALVGLFGYGYVNMQINIWGLINMYGRVGLHMNSCLSVCFFHVCVVPSSFSRKRAVAPVVFSSEDQLHYFSFQVLGEMEIESFTLKYAHSPFN